ncbi:oxidoreductase [Marinilongibacter aquaticus]|uniref:oxidoreductase n=1 Tax=Marinilongibacter aquaticus TaxID=2975157 RepID=UPI0021BD3BD4|nr:oxidoreductase [Marinilongibacter aquaticus]UBM60247.1 oxidoreductase [Marinilongibacter aquaticus]
MPKTALIAGASGLVGSHLLKKLLASEDYEKVVSIGRRKTGLNHAKLTELEVDFDKLETYAFRADQYFCCLGTTIKNAGSKENFRKVDFAYPLHLAQIAEKNEAELFAVVTAMGADPFSSFFYNRVKGQLEEKLKSIRLENIGVFRPAMLLGERKESRTGEAVGKVLVKLLDILIPKNYKGIPAENVAEAMIEYAKNPQGRFQIILSGDMN